MTHYMEKYMKYYKSAKIVEDDGEELIVNQKVVESPPMNVIKDFIRMTEGGYMCDYKFKDEYDLETKVSIIKKALMDAANHRRFIEIASMEEYEEYKEELGVKILDEDDILSINPNDVDYESAIEGNWSSWGDTTTRNYVNEILDDEE